MKRRQRRIISQYTSYFIFLFIVGFAWYQGNHVLEFFHSNSKAIQLSAVKEEKKVLEEVPQERIVEATASQVSDVLQANEVKGSTKGKCGTAWQWNCDDSKQVNNKMNKTDLPANSLKLIETSMIKNPQGLGLSDGVSTKAKIDTDGDGVNDETFGWCLVGGEKYETLSAISMSQVVLPAPQTLGSERSMRAYDFEADEYVEIAQDILDSIKTKDYMKFCDPNNKSLEYIMRSMDIYTITPEARRKAENWVSGILAQCNSQAPGTTADEFAANWVSEDNGIAVTTFMLGIENNERHDKVDQKFIPRLENKTIGLIAPGNDYLYTYTFQPSTPDYEGVKLFGSTVGTRTVADSLQSPQKTSAQLMLHPEYIDVAPANEDSSTIVSTTDTGKQYEKLRSSFESAIFGGFYHIENKGIEKSSTPNTLSYLPNSFSAGKYSCDPDQGNCPVVRAITGCSDTGNVNIDIRLRQIVLTSNDTSRYSNIVNDAPRPYVLGGNFIEGINTAPQGVIKKASMDELIKFSGRATGTCSQFLDEKIALQDSTLSQIEIDMLTRRVENLTYETPGMLATPIHVIAKTQVLYDVNVPLINWLNNLFGLGLSTDGMKETTTKAYKPALISFKKDTYVAGAVGLGPNEEAAELGYEEQEKFLEEEYGILNYGDSWGIDCGLLADGNGDLFEEYWFCLSSGGGLFPKCSN